MRISAILQGLLAFGVLLTLSTVVRGDELADRLVYWESQAFYCNSARGPFPSKEGAGGICDDGDMTLFNGLLCIAGDSRGCDGVRLAQGPDGRWWRSPDRIDKDWFGKHGVSLSPDQALGVLLYITATGDKAAFEQWVSWIDANRPCVIKLVGKCYVFGWPRYCDDDVPDKRCTFRPVDCGQLEVIGHNIGASNGALCKKVLQEFKIEVDDFFVPVEHLAAGSALLNEPGFPMHLAATRILLLERNGLASDSTRMGSLALSLREPRNPFFKFVSEGKTARVRQMVLDLCPSPERPSLQRFQWAWERKATEQAWLKSMYWDCIFMAHLLK
jgi:hypothetical protein